MLSVQNKPCSAPFFLSAFSKHHYFTHSEASAPRDEKQRGCIVLIFEWSLPFYKWAAKWPLEAQWMFQAFKWTHWAHQLELSTHFSMPPLLLLPPSPVVQLKPLNMNKSIAVRNIMWCKAEKVGLHPDTMLDIKPVIKLQKIRAVT